MALKKAKDSEQSGALLNWQVIVNCERERDAYTIETITSEYEYPARGFHLLSGNVSSLYAKQRSNMELAHALKEWQVAVSALEKGESIALLRKGGIREVGGRFEVQHDQVLLYPTYEHQNPQFLKAPYSNLVQPVESGWHPDVVQIGSWGVITHVLQVSDAEILARLLPFHIWNEVFVMERLKWKPSQPIYVLLLRVYQLPQPQAIAYSSIYGGCKSWIDLAEPISLEASTPVLETVAYNGIVSKIYAAIRGE